MQNPQQQFHKQQKDFSRQQAANRQKWLEQAAYADQQAAGGYAASTPSRGCATSAKMLLTLFVGGPILLALCGLIGYVIGFSMSQEAAYILAAGGGLIALFVTALAVIAVSNR